MLKEILLSMVALIPFNENTWVNRYNTEMTIGYEYLSEKEYDENPVWRRWEEKHENIGMNFNMVEIPKEKMDKFPLKDRTMLPELYTKNTMEFVWLKHNIVLYCTYERE